MPKNSFATAAGRLIERYRILLAALMFLLSGLSLISVMDHPADTDVDLYRRVATEVAAGKLPYRDFTLEYPPYAILFFLLPTLFGSEGYTIAFKAIVLTADLIAKCLLLAIGLREAKGMRSLLPLVCYSVAVLFIRDFYLQRYDLFPALFSLMAVWVFSFKRYTLSGFLVALGACVKVYPALFALPLFVIACRECKGRNFAAGFTLGSAPILLLAVIVPWWRFLGYHVERGLQAESTYASVLWLAHLLGIIEAQWQFAVGSRSFEVHGKLAHHILPWSQLWFLVSVGMSTALACRAGGRLYDLAASSLSLLMLFPLLAFVAFGQVFSPQFMVWLLPFAALASLGRSHWITSTITAATVLTAVFYLSPGYYGAGVHLFHATLVVIRNIILIWIWGLLVRKLLQRPLASSDSLD